MQQCGPAPRRALKRSKTICLVFRSQLISTPYLQEEKRGYGTSSSKGQALTVVPVGSGGYYGQVLTAAFLLTLPIRFQHRGMLRHPMVNKQSQHPALSRDTRCTEDSTKSTARGGCCRDRLNVAAETHVHVIDDETSGISSTYEATRGTS